MRPIHLFLLLPLSVLVSCAHVEPEWNVLYRAFGKDYQSEGITFWVGEPFSDRTVSAVHVTETAIWIAEETEEGAQGITTQLSACENVEPAVEGIKQAVVELVEHTLSPEPSTREEFAEDVSTLDGPRYGLDIDGRRGVNISMYGGKQSIRVRTLRESVFELSELIHECNDT